MGDRCSVSIVCKASDVDKFEHHFGGTACNDPLMAGVRDIYFEEVNYRGEEELIEVAQKDIVFYGTHGSGDDYGPGAFVGIDGEFIAVPMTLEGTYYVEYYNPGGVQPEDVKRIEKFFSMRLRAMDRLSIKPPSVFKASVCDDND